MAAGPKRRLAVADRCGCEMIVAGAARTQNRRKRFRLPLARRIGLSKGPQPPWAVGKCHGGRAEPEAIDEYWEPREHRHTASTPPGLPSQLRQRSHLVHRS